MVAAVILKTHEADRILVVPVVETAAGDYVLVPVALQVRHDGAECAGKVPHAVERELAAAHVLQPLDPVPGSGTGRGIVEAVAVGVDNVGPAVLVHVRDAQAAAAIVLVGRAIEYAVAKVSVPVVHERMDRSEE